MMFSIIIPVYNVQNYLKRCIDSVLCQTFSDFEIILIDDGSTDNSGNICDCYSKNDKRIKTIHTENRGPTHARKVGANVSSGDYILCLDSDDTFVEEFLAWAAEDIKKNPLVPVFVYSNNIIYYDRVDQNILTLLPRIYIGKDMDTIKQNAVYDSNKKWPNCGSISYSVWGKVIKRDIFVKCQNDVDDNTTIGEDLLVIVKIINSISAILVSNHIVYNYYINNNSITHSFKFEQIEKIQNAVRILYDDVSDKNKAYVFALSNFMQQLGLIIDLFNYNKYCSMLKIIKNNYNLLWNFALKAKIKKASLKKKILLLILKCRMFSLLYFYSFITKKYNANHK